MMRICVAAAALMLLAGPVIAQDAKTIVSNASKAMGADNLNSITYYGSGANYNLGQSNNANGPWPQTNLNDYRRSIDFAQPALRSSAVTYGVPVTGGPAAPGRVDQVVTPPQHT